MAVKQAVIESGRAEDALKAVKKVVEDYPYGTGKKELELTETEKENMKIQKEYQSYARKFPSLVLTNGLAAAIAFANEKGRGNKAWNRIYTNISERLIKECFFAKPTELMDYVCSLDSDTYRLVTGEVLSLFEWLRRFAGGLIEGEAE